MMRARHWLFVLFHLLLWVSVAWGIYTYAVATREASFLKILGSTEKDLSLPVFAQFVVTQTLFFDRPLVATELIIPLYLPNEPLPMKVSLYQDGRLVTWWRYPLKPIEYSEGYKVAHLQFLIPTILQGKMEVRFDGSSLGYDQQAHAPRLFTETFDAAYPYGNYRIAQNDKKGDIALEFMEQKTNYEIFVQDIGRNALGRGTQAILCFCALILLACLPSMIANP